MIIGFKNNIRDNYFEEKLNELTINHRDVSIRYIYDLDTHLNDIDILIVSSKITLEDLLTANKLKILIIPFTGVNPLPLEELKKRNITVVNTHAHAPIVSERAFTLGLSILGRVVELHNQLEKGKWSGYDHNSKWLSLSNLRCGIIGMGEIGLNLLNYLKPFNTKNITLTRYRSKLKDVTDIEYYDNIASVCQNSDIIFLSLPLTNETTHIINKDILSLMEGKFLVNVGRGELIKEEDLYQALKNNVLKGAALDVWYQYPLKDNKVNFPSKYPFHKLKNIILSPHCSGNEINSRKNVINEITKNIDYYLKNKVINNVVNIEKGY